MLFGVVWRCSMMFNAVERLWSRSLAGFGAFCRAYTRLWWAYTALWRTYTVLSGDLWPRSLAFSGALCRLSGALWRPLILLWTLNGPLAAFGGLAASLALSGGR